MDIVQHVSLNEQVYNILKRRIIERRFNAGAKLDINALAQELGTSRMPIIDALTHLETEGLVERRNRVGTFVTALDRTKYEELYSTREMIEQWAAGRIMIRITDEDIRKLWRILDETRKLIENVTEDTFDY